MPFCPRSSVRSERHRAKVEVAGATPAVDAILASVPQQPQDEFCKLVFVGASPTRGSIQVNGVLEQWSSGEAVAKPVLSITPTLPYSITPFRSGDHDVTAASRPVKAFVPVRIRLVTPTFQVQSVRSSREK